MNNLPASEAVLGRMTTTFQNSATVLSIGIFFTVITLADGAALPKPLL